MTIITCKDNVRLKGVTPALAWIFYVLDGFVRHSAAKYLPGELVITAIYDGKHLPDSKHYLGEAVDIRSKNFATLADRTTFRKELEDALNNHPLATAQGVGNRFRVLFEDAGTDNEHLHVQVKKGSNFPGV
jgi:hypothetical protein